jgi:hypothetical protein
MAGITAILLTVLGAITFVGGIGAIVALVAMAKSPYRN